MVALPASFTPDPFVPVVRRLTLNTAHGTLRGNFIVLVEPELVLVALAVDGTKPGTCFVQKLRRGAGERKIVYLRYGSIYKALRAHRSYIKGWAMASSSILTDLHALSRASLMATYGVPVLEPGEFGALQERLRSILEEREDGKEFSHHRQAVHAIQMYRATETRRGSKRRVLGYMSAVGNFAGRRAEVDSIGECAVSIGTLIAHYIGAVIVGVRKVRAELDALLVLTAEDVYMATNTEAFVRYEETLRTILAARPFTHVRGYAVPECREIATLIRREVDEASTPIRGFERLREQITVTRNSLLLLEWQYDLEVFLTQIAEWVRTAYEPAPDEWDWLIDQLRELLGKVPERLGRRFQNDIVPDIRRFLESAIQRSADHRTLGDLRGLKIDLVEVSSKV